MKSFVPAAKSRLALAFEWATSARPVPDAWTARALEIGLSPSKTYVAALLTAALARATTSEVDAQWLKVTDDPRSYSARGLCHKVLVPASDLLGFSLGATGREPLNNQPFFRYDRIDGMDRVLKNAQLHRDLLVSAVDDLNRLDEGEALAALAAMLRTRLRIAGERVALGPVDVSYAHLVNAIERLLLNDAEGGRRAQAVVAAAFDLIFDVVRVERVNSPSRHFPGDVVALINGLPAVSAEVRQKPVKDDDVHRFVRVLERAAIGRGMMVAFAPNPDLAPRSELERWARREAGVALTIHDTVHGFLMDVVGTSPRELASLLLAYPDRLARRLEDLESPAGLSVWVAEW
jgi:SacI restriction endonuclease